MYNAGAHCSVGRAQYRQAAVILKFSYLPLKLKICSTAIVSPSLPATPPPPKMNSHWNTQKTPASRWPQLFLLLGERAVLLCR